MAPKKISGGLGLLACEGLVKKFFFAAFFFLCFFCGVVFQKPKQTNWNACGKRNFDATFLRGKKKRKSTQKMCKEMERKHKFIKYVELLFRWHSFVCARAKLGDVRAKTFAGF